jgi:hypothetical protein
VFLLVPQINKKLSVLTVLRIPVPLVAVLELGIIPVFVPPVLLPPTLLPQPVMLLMELLL